MDRELVARGVRKISQIFFLIIRCYIWFNFFMMGFALYNMIHSPLHMAKTHFWLFLLFLGNFWIILFFFFILSICMKICIIHYEPNIQDIPRLFPLLNEFLWGEEEEDSIDLIANISLYESSSQENRRPPSSMDYQNMESKWGSILRPQSTIPEEERCLICLQDYQDPASCYILACGCNSSAHKKCFLEWFYFSEREDQEFRVSCPSCRFVFTGS